MEDLTLFEQYPIFQLISYIITVIIGGVGYKFYKQSSENKLANRKHESDEGQKLVLNLSERVTNLTKKIDKYEDELKELYERELKRVEELAEAKADVRLLSQRVKYLEERILELQKENIQYKKKYGEVSD